MATPFACVCVSVYPLIAPVLVCGESVTYTFFVFLNRAYDHFVKVTRELCELTAAAVEVRVFPDSQNEAVSTPVLQRVCCHCSSS